jgi:hypothetical protein
MRRFFVVLVALFVASPALAETIYYGERDGMELTVVKKSGIGTTHARILTKHTRENAIAYCRNYVGKVTEDCIARELKNPLHLEITANCRTGKFTTFYGASMVFKGRNKAGSAADYAILDVESGQILDGSGASSYGSSIGQFEALCPNRVK